MSTLSGNAKYYQCSGNVVSMVASECSTLVFSVRVSYLKMTVPVCVQCGLSLRIKAVLSESLESSCFLFLPGISFCSGMLLLSRY